MSEEIIKVLDDLSARFGVVIDWGSAKALPALQELFEKFVHYKMVMHSTGIAISVLLIALFVYLIIAMVRDYTLCKNSRENKYFWEYSEYLNDADSSFVGGISLFTTIIAFPASIIAGLYNSFKLIKLIMIPELYVLEYLINYSN